MQRCVQKKNERMGGFLLLFAVAQCASCGVNFLAMLGLGDYMELFFRGNFYRDIRVALSILFAFGVSSLTFIYLLMLGLREPRFFQVLTLSYILRPAALIILALTGIIVKQGTAERLLDRVFVGWIVWSVLAAVLWQVYFLKSRRVRAYMGTDAYITKHLLFRHITPPPAQPSSTANGST